MKSSMVFATPGYTTKCLVATSLRKAYQNKAQLYQNRAKVSLKVQLKKGQHMLVFTIVEVRLPTTTKQKGKLSLKLKLTNSYKRLGTPDHDKAYQDKAQPYQSRAKHSLKMQFEKGSTCLPYHCGDKAFHDYKTEWVRLPSSSS